MARVLLNRYGVVFRELLARENFPIRWREMLITLRRLEDRGDVRGGRFVDGFLGEQFALPLAVDSLRAARKAPASGERVTVSAADPLNLVGIIVPGERVPANSGRSVTFCDGLSAMGAIGVSALRNGLAPRTLQNESRKNDFAAQRVIQHGEGLAVNLVDGGGGQQERDDEPASPPRVHGL